MLRRLNLFLIFGLLLVGAGAGGYLIYDEQRTHSLIVAAGARSSEGFQLMQAIADVVNQHHPKIQIEVIESGQPIDLLAPVNSVASLLSLILLTLRMAHKQLFK